MTLQQKLTDMIGRWDGSDATQRLANREQLVSELTAMVESEWALKSALAAAEAPAPTGSTKAA